MRKEESLVKNIARNIFTWNINPVWKNPSLLAKSLRFEKLENRQLLNGEMESVLGSIPSGASDENGFVTIAGPLVENSSTETPPVSAIIDDGSSAFTQTGFSYFANPDLSGYQTGWHRLKVQDGAGTASWTFTGLSSGEYRVSATWPAKSNRASDAPFAVHAGSGIQLATASLNQQLAPDDRTNAGSDWEDVTNVSFDGGTLVVSLSESPGETGQVIADAVRIERIGNGVPTLAISFAPNEIAESGESATGTLYRFAGAAGDLVVDLASSDPARATVPASVTIPNGADSVDFALTAIDNAAAEGDQTLVVTASAASYSDAVASLAISDDEAYLLPQIIDDGSAGFSQTDFDYLANPGVTGYETDWHRLRAEDGEGEASWSFTGLASGHYRVSATWPAKGNRASDADFYLEDGSGNPLAIAQLNQQLAPASFSEDGTDWEGLAFVNVSDGAITVKLSESAGKTGQVIADAIGIQWTDDLHPGLALSFSGSQVAEAAGTVTGTVSRGLENTTGTLVVTLQSDDSTEASVPASVTIADGASSADFTLTGVNDAGYDGDQASTIVATATGYVSGLARITTTDDDILGPAIIIDDGDSGFSSDFDYFADPGLPGYETDWHRKKVNDGAGEAQWHFTGLANGEYYVGATWTEKSNRATDAPYTIEDGSGTLLASASVNQRLAPASLEEDGTLWETLAIVLVDDGELVVKLNESPGATGQVIADAIVLREVPPQNLAPLIADQFFSIGEDSGAGSVVGTLIASDPDGDNLSYSILENIDPDEDGVAAFRLEDDRILVNDPGDLDADVNPALEITVEASDGSLSDSASVTVAVNQSEGVIFHIPAGDSIAFGEALSSAQGGDIIELEAGSTYLGSFELLKKQSDEVIVIRTSAHASLPEGRVSPEDAPLMAKISSRSTYSTIYAEFGASNYRLEGLEIVSSLSSTSALILLGYSGNQSANALEDFSDNITIDRCYMHGEQQQRIQRAVLVNGSNVTLSNSYISEIHMEGFDSQAFLATKGTGPYTIENNFLEAAGENILFGGGVDDLSDPAFNIQGITIKNNHISKPDRWNAGKPENGIPAHPDYDGSEWSVKNLVEFKIGRDILVEGNVIENVWRASQDGGAILVTPREAFIDNIVFRNNVIRDARYAFQLTPADHELSNVVIENNLIYNMEWRIFEATATIGKQVENLTIRNNTALFEGDSGTVNLILGDGDVSVSNLIYQDNLMSSGQYGIHGSDRTPGLDSVDYYCNGFDVRGNAIIDPFSNAEMVYRIDDNYAANGDFYGDFSLCGTVNEVGFADIAFDDIEDFRVTDNPALQTAGTGADMDALLLAVDSVVLGGLGGL